MSRGNVRVLYDDHRYETDKGGPLFRETTLELGGYPANSIILRGKRLTYPTLVAYFVHFAWAPRVVCAAQAREYSVRVGRLMDLHLKRIVSKRIINV